MEFSEILKIFYKKITFSATLSWRLLQKNVQKKPVLMDLSLHISRHSETSADYVILISTKINKNFCNASYLYCVNEGSCTKMSFRVVWRA